jgi:hypothetical protein
LLLARLDDTWVELRLLLDAVLQDMGEIGGALHEFRSTANARFEHDQRASSAEPCRKGDSGNARTVKEENARSFDTFEKCHRPRNRKRPMPSGLAAAQRADKEELVPLTLGEVKDDRCTYGAITLNL